MAPKLPLTLASEVNMWDDMPNMAVEALDAFFITASALLDGVLGGESPDIGEQGYTALYLRVYKAIRASIARAIFQQAEPRRRYLCSQ